MNQIGAFWNSSLHLDTGVNPSDPDRRMNQIGAFLKSSLHLDIKRGARGAGVNPSDPDRRMNQIGAFLKSSLHLDSRINKSAPDGRRFPNGNEGATLLNTVH